jgi:hypothetical protein
MDSLRSSAYINYKSMIEGVEYAEEQSRITDTIINEVIIDLATAPLGRERFQDYGTRTSVVHVNQFQVRRCGDVKIEWSVWETGEAPTHHELPTISGFYVFAKATIKWWKPESMLNSHFQAEIEDVSVDGHGFIKKSQRTADFSEIKQLLTNSLRAAIAAFMEMKPKPLDEDGFMYRSL